jgi:hypothetical protein
VQGDVTCDGLVTGDDLVALLLHEAGIPLPAPSGCPPIEEIAAAGEAAGPGDVNCDGFVDARDALTLLLWLAELPAGQPEGCTAIGQPLA